MAWPNVMAVVSVSVTVLAAALMATAVTALALPPVVTLKAVLAGALDAAFSVLASVYVSTTWLPTPDALANSGASVSMAIAGVVPAEPELPAASVYSPVATVMLAVAAAVLAVGVKVALRVKPVPVIVPSVPPAVMMSPATKLVSGSSLKVKMMPAVSPALTTATLLVIASVGATVSTVMFLVPAVLRLPAVSVCRADKA